MKTTSLENRFIEAIDKHRHALLLVFLFLAGAAIRWAGRYFISEDMEVCLIPWFEKIRAAGGLSALSSQVGDYGLLYQTLISLMTYLPIPAIIQYKLLSAVFDVGLALLVGAMYRDLRANGFSLAADGGSISAEMPQVRLQSWFVAAVVWLLPTVILNSSYWGQCDSMYAFFALATLYLLRRGSIVKAFVLMGLAFSCKLQAVFIVPMIVVVYLLSKRFSLLWVLLSVVVMWLSGIVAYAYGRNLLTPFLIYTGQVGHYQEMYMSFPSLWMLVGNDYWSLRWFAILLTLVVLATGLWYCLDHKVAIISRERYYAVAAWFMWSMLLFLPGMHDRYAFMLDLLLVLVGCLDRRFVKYAVVTVLISLYYYGIYLFGERGEGHVLLALVYLLAYLHYTRTLVRDIGREGVSVTE